MAFAMNRREMMALCGAALLGRAAGQDSRTLVDSPEKRAAYLKAMLRAFCAEIGPRPAGSPGFDAGARLIEREMRSALRSVSLDPFSFTCWQPEGEAEFRVGGQSLETYLAENSPGTPPSGVRGRLRTSHSEGYELVDPRSQRPLARVGVSEFGRAITTIHSGQDAIPLFNIGKQDVAILDRAAQENLPVRAKAQVKWVPGVRTANVVGTLPGTSREEIVVVAHADTKYNTPGANDNTASMICLLMLAHAMSATHPHRTVTFLATTGEERGYIGARHYAQARKEKGTLGDIRVCINLDSLTYGPNLQIATTDRKLEGLILDIHRDLAIKTHPKVLPQDDTMDSAPFHAAGARTVHLNSRGDDARTLPLWHRPEDRAETVNPEFIESSFRVLMELCARLQVA